ncbi:hypothetical protein KC678_04135 [Candidatus Dojkabacteria bacterium]|uniref:Cohesin domain-containing protein n=1 Tax=Candidatus Dojkabacteria bacterium TaxID=2099670 RepID=A0A955L205_9BACT|nr:hypothetical protein [Candidatus Dojkabacteria bacterium]
MAKSEKLLLLVAVLLTIVAVAFWSVNLTSKSDTLPDTNNTTDTRRVPGEDLGFNGDPSFTEENLEVLPNFGVSLDSSELNTVSVDLKGDTLNVRSAEAVIMYNPDVVSITSITQGDLFDLYITTDLSEPVEKDANGMAYVSIAGSFVGDELPEVKTDGTLATLEYTALTDAPAIFTVVQFEKGADNYSKVITEDGQSYTVAETSVSL